MLLKIAYDVTGTRPRPFKILLTWQYLQFGYWKLAEIRDLGRDYPLDIRCEIQSLCNERFRIHGYVSKKYKWLGAGPYDIFSNIFSN